MHGHECVTKSVICLLYEALRLIYVDVCWLDIVTDKLELGPLNIFKVIYVVGTGTTILYSYLHIHIAWVLLILALSLTTLEVDQDNILNNYIINYRPKGYRYVYYRLKGSWLDLTGLYCHAWHSWRMDFITKIKSCIHVDVHQRENILSKDAY